MRTVLTLSSFNGNQCIITKRFSHLPPLSLHTAALHFTPLPQKSFLHCHILISSAPKRRYARLQPGWCWWDGHRADRAKGRGGACILGAGTDSAGGRQELGWRAAIVRPGCWGNGRDFERLKYWWGEVETRDRGWERCFCRFPMGLQRSKTSLVSPPPSPDLFNTFRPHPHWCVFI